MDKQTLASEIRELKKQRNAVILAHYYTSPEVQDAADYVGDSFGLSKMAAQVTLKVQFTLPQGTELEKLEKKSLVTFIYVGEPTQEYRAKMGTESRIQLNDSYAEVGEVQDFIFQERASMSEGDAAKMTVSLKVDQKTKMGIVTDVKNALRKSYALKINYSATKRGEK